MILGIDTLRTRTAIAVGSHAREFQETGSQAEDLLDDIKTVMNDAGAGFADLRAVVALTGPGSFTGLRVGLAAAHGIAFSQNIPLYGITAPQAFAALMPNDRDVMLLLDTRRSDLAVAVRRAGEAAFEPLRELTFEAIEDRLGKDPMPLCGNGCLRLKEELVQEYGCIAQWIGIESVVRHFDSNTTDLATVYAAIDADPVYLRAPDVTISSKKFEHQTLYKQS